MTVYKYKEASEKTPFTHILIKSKEELDNIMEQLKRMFENEDEMYKVYTEDKKWGQRQITHRSWATPTAVLARLITSLLDSKSLGAITPSMFFSTYFKTMEYFFEKEKAFLINTSFGFSPISAFDLEKDFTKIELAEENLFLNKFLHKATKETDETVLLLENDPDLDYWINNNLSKGTFNYILNAKTNVKNGEYKKILKELKKEGKPLRLLEYTTALDFDRLETAVNQAILQGVKRFTYILAEDENLEKVKNFFEELKENVTLEDVQIIRKDDY